MKQNFTCESHSPLIEYRGTWTAEVGNVPASLNVASAIRMVSQTRGDAASFNFTGTAVWVYPASNTPRGSYDVYLDGSPARFDPTDGPPSVGIPLFNRTGLLSIPHVLSIHNTGTNRSSNGGYLDLSVIIWEERDKYGNATDVSIQGDEDDSSAFSWYPFDTWTEHSQNVVQDSAGGGQASTTVSLSLHTANASDAWMQYNFSANTISIYGNVGPTHGPYSVVLKYILDNGTATAGDNDDSFDLPDETFFNASFPFDRTKVLLFHAANINASRTTTLTLRNHPEKQGDSISIDYSVLARYIMDPNASRRSSFPVPAMVGSIIGAILMLGLVIVTCYFLRRRRQGQLIRQQKINLFRDILTKRGVLAAPNGNDVKKANPGDFDSEHNHDMVKQ